MTMRMGTLSGSRPSVRIYLREHPEWRSIMDVCDGPYEFGYECAMADVRAGLAAMGEDEMAGLWHRDYSEGYRDAYADCA